MTSRPKMLHSGLPLIALGFYASVAFSSIASLPLD
jgi:hypothetical protein